MEIINIKRYDCPYCGYDQLQKKGKTNEGKQRFKCKGCNKNSTQGGLKKGEKFFKKEKLLPILLKNLDTEDLTNQELYSMGLLIADGCIDMQNRLSISLQEKDGYILEYVKTALFIKNEVKLYKTTKTETSTSWSNKDSLFKRLTWGYKHAPKYWEKLGMFKQKTGNEIWLPYMNSWNFVRGFFDGDGCISIRKDKKSSPTIIFTCANLEFLQALQKFIGRYINNYGSLYKDKSAFALSFSKKDLLKICAYMYEDSDGLRLERKYQKYLEIKNSIK